MSPVTSSASRQDYKALRSIDGHVRSHGAVDGRAVRLARPAFRPPTDHPGASGLPLVVDLDGTLLRSDLLIEAGFSELSRRPGALLDLVASLTRGKAALKHRLSDTTHFDPSLLPYDDEVIGRIQQAQADGRHVYLASASHEELVSAVAHHLGLFDGYFASSSTLNLAGIEKARRLVETFGERGFDYIGNDAADLPVWSVAHKAIAIRAPARVARRLAAVAADAEHLDYQRPTWKTWAKLLRVHQYAKNALVFLPLLTAHRLDAASVGLACLAFLSLSLCASGVYILNDLVDLKDDRGHRTKCNRPLACGAVPIAHGVLAFPLLLLVGVGIATAVSSTFVAVVLGYLALTTAYSFFLKRKMLIDVITLAGLYSVRVIAGAVAIEVVPSKWLIGFCLALFLSLALIKRYVELAARLDANLPAASNRGYKTSDIEMVGSLAAAAGFNAVLVLALYLSSASVQLLYSRPELLWLACPILAYWIARALMLAHRREMDDDPVVFALKDRLSLVATGAICVLGVAAL